MADSTINPFGIRAKLQRLSTVKVEKPTVPAEKATNNEKGSGIKEKASQEKIASCLIFPCWQKDTKIHIAHRRLKVFSCPSYLMGRDVFIAVKLYLA